DIDSVCATSGSVDPKMARLPNSRRRCKFTEGPCAIPTPAYLHHRHDRQRLPIVIRHGVSWRIQCGSFGRSRPYVHVPASALNTATTITDTPDPTSATSGPGHAPVSAHPKPNIVPPAR